MYPHGLDRFGEGNGGVDGPAGNSSHYSPQWRYVNTWNFSERLYVGTSAICNVCLSPTVEGITESKALWLYCYMFQDDSSSSSYK